MYCTSLHPNMKAHTGTQGVYVQVTTRLRGRYRIYWRDPRASAVNTIPPEAGG